MMTRQNDMTAEALSRGAIPGRGYNLARVISQVLHPITLAMVSLLIVGIFGVENARESAIWIMINAGLQVVPPLIFFTLRLRQGAYSDDDISIRSQRNELYIFGIVNLLVGLLILRLLEAPLPFQALVVAGLLLSFLGWMINLAWKISVHAASMGSTATIASLYSEPLGLVLWLCALVLGWARVRTRNHTPLQVVAGMALATICVLVTFSVFGLLTMTP
jgi:membrane-associated phospholipid phosphatase